MMVTDNQRRLTHQVVIAPAPYAKIQQICTWCQNQFGKSFGIIDSDIDGTWRGVYHEISSGVPISYKFLFDHEDDAVLFALKWC